MMSCRLLSRFLFSFTAALLISAIDGSAAAQTSPPEGEIPGCGPKADCVGPGHATRTKSLKGRMGHLEHDMNRQGSDRAHLDVSDPVACARKCEKDRLCKAMTFVPKQAGGGGVCWLKGAVPPTTGSAGMVSARKIE
jgi:hypothetical protein